ncbi:MAG: RAMP superfamily CRISPR-associated protein [Spirochaetia bacterium]|jgi:CRISPR-associated protein Csm4|nr:RAMP superfamily CRISPR-associated protein [Spirochaetia bacterium]
MKYCKLRFCAKSAFSNLFTADQVWGQMVWAISALEGEAAATKFVEDFDEVPPFVLSAMMPEGFLPRVVLPPMQSKEKMNAVEERKARERVKSNKKRKWIPINTLLEVQDNIALLSQKEIPGKKDQEVIQPVNEVHVSLDRTTNTPFEDGGLYNQQYYISTKPLIVYVRLDRDETEWSAWLKKICKYLEAVGIGGDRTVGKGSFSISVEELDESEQKLFDYKGGNAWISLSRCAGRNLKPLYYTISLYAGITGGSLTEAKTYNKYPVLYYEPGSLFDAGGGTGSLLHHVQEDPRICSYGYLFPLPVRSIGE